MAIAKNFRKYAEALLVQLELPLQGFAKTIQNMRGAVLAAYRRSLDAGTWKRSRFMQKPKKKPAQWRAIDVPGCWFWGQLDLIKATELQP
ncbi:hypothetical protein H5407_19690 [Mitsuaria sp. WAJ17]|uniref:hypothetical protein n=1 Tax=Mitsuaria sp. WAJ17 TaxID=2761452 RepID=UPI001603BE6B|nr:hypothetical protein [Mitsuaria sp. WAJ17]MBB2487463.1 hypothetical protein [Mitsuaria sp. WAJ17]